MSSNICHCSMQLIIIDGFLSAIVINHTVLIYLNMDQISILLLVSFMPH